MSESYKHPMVRVSIFLISILALAMLWFYIQGYSTSLGWSLTTEADFEETVAYNFQKGPFQFSLVGDRVVLSESFYGEPIEDLRVTRTVFFLMVVVGIAMLTACASYFKQVGFLAYSAAFIFFLIQLDLDLYLGQPKWILLVPIVLTIGAGYYFHAYRTYTTFILRFLAILLTIGVPLAFIPKGLPAFSQHFFAEGILPLGIAIFVFLALIAEELIFGLLFVLTKAKGSKNNHVHLLLIGGIYVLNLLGYYLNKAGLLDFSFTFMNPFILMVLSTGVAIWSLRFKEELLGNFHFVPAFIFFIGFGIISYSVLGWSFAQGMDVIPEAFHYLIIYTHLSFGFFFFAYIILNLIDPLAKGLQVYKIVYKPHGFHYATARLAGLAFVAAFYFLSSQLTYKLFQSARFSMLGDIELMGGNEDLAQTYYGNAEFLGFNAHYPNYQLGSIYLNRQNQEMARRHFEKASKRRPSPQAFLNTSNLQSQADLSLSKVNLETGLLTYGAQPELLNNLGIVNWKNGLLNQAYQSFKNTSSRQSWNQAPLVNKWGVVSSLQSMQGDDPEVDFLMGNLPVKTNILAAHLSSGSLPDLTYDSIWLGDSGYSLHRQAMLLNSSLVFSDDGLTHQLTKELETASFGFVQELTKAKALNQYRSGKVKSAFHEFDQIVRGRSGVEAGEALNEMGLLALDQGAPREARDFFTQAMNEGFDARFHRMVAFLEYGDFSNAELQLRELISSDSSYHSLKDALANVFTPGSDTTLQARFNELYFRLPELASADVKSRMKDFDETTQGILIRRISGLVEKEVISEEAYSSLGVSYPDYSDLDSAELVSYARENPFREAAILTAAQLLTVNDPIEAYSLLNESLEINPYSIPLLKAKAMSAIDINLPEYARETLVTLSNLLSPELYSAFEIEWYRKRNEKEQQTWPY